ncbi:MAG TPA: c-type cytochrome [Deltaproteobacteria bacterium]|nr:c-type cytochrome [Deltaproteobacteria bacterium]
MKNRVIILAFILTVLPGLALAAKGDVNRGKEIYDKRCWWCHGEEGMGDGPAAETLNPPPRDFTFGLYKFKTTPFDEMVPSDQDFYNMVKGEMAKNHIVGWTGMNDSSMPGWGDMLTDQEIWDVIAYIKTFAEFEDPEKPPVDVSGQIPSSPESIAKGEKIFKDLCAECHGEAGRGDATKKLKDDLGFRTWPRNLTKGWSFRVSNDPKDIFYRVTVGIPGTQMPSFADPASTKKLSEEDRWHVANYVASLDAPYKKPGDNTVIQGTLVEGPLPDDPNDPAWDQAQYVSFYMVPQIIAEERHFTPSLNSISAKALFNEKEIALLIEWDDRTRSLPGDAKAIEIADGDVFVDGVAVQFPVTVKSSEKPYFGMGDPSNPVNIWFWQSAAGEGESPTLKLLNGTGIDNLEERDPAEAGLTFKSAYDKGTWRVVMKRPLQTDDKEKDLQFTPGKYIPIAFAAWDGSNQEEGSKHVMTTWYWLLLKPTVGAELYLWPAIIALVVLGVEVAWLWSARKNR